MNLPDTPATVAERIARTNRQVLALVEPLPEDRFVHRAGTRSPSIRFHVFHLSRWSDVARSWLPRLTPALASRLGDQPEIWDRKGLADVWGLAGRQLGVDRTGMGLPDDEAAALPLPRKEVLLAYSREAFSELERALAVLDQQAFDTSCRDWAGRETTVAGVVLHHLIHISRHLGMIEALIGVSGGRGTATQ